MENWKKIEGENLLYDYIISDNGTIVRLESEMWRECSIKGRFLTIRKRRVLKTRINERGYVKVSLQTKDGQKHFPIHRLLAKTFIPNPENKPMVNHINGNKLDNSLENLEWSTASENEKHAYDNGLKFGLKGSKNPNSILSENDVIYIKKRLNSGENVKSISEDFSVNFRNIYNIIYNIKKGRTWSHIKIN